MEALLATAGIPTNVMDIVQVVCRGDASVCRSILEGVAAAHITGTLDLLRILEKEVTEGKTFLEKFLDMAIESMTGAKIYAETLIVNFVGGDQTYGQELLGESIEMIMDTARKIILWACSNPGQAFIIVLGVFTTAAPAAVTSPALWALGFSSEGIIVNSIAAGIQASIGDVVAGSIFATLQSAAMSGYGAAIVNGVVQGVGAGVTALGGIVGGKNKGSA